MSEVEQHPPANRAVIVGPLIVAVLLLLGVRRWRRNILTCPDGPGAFSGAVVPKVLGKFLAPQIQSHWTVFLGGITTGNIGSSGAGLHNLITRIADKINELVALIPASAGDISAATTLRLMDCAVNRTGDSRGNAYYAKPQSSPVGNHVEKFAAGPAAPERDGGKCGEG